MTPPPPIPMNQEESPQRNTVQQAPHDSARIPQQTAQKAKSPFQDLESQQEQSRKDNAQSEKASQAAKPSKLLSPTTSVSQKSQTTNGDINADEPEIPKTTRRVKKPVPEESDSPAEIPSDASEASPKTKQPLTPISSS